MNNKHTGPYVPEAMYACHGCGNPSLPARLYWMDLSEFWLCDHCLNDLEEPIHRSTPCLADHLKSLEPRWVPVSERLPEFRDVEDSGVRLLWKGWIMLNANPKRIDVDWWDKEEFHRLQDEDRITHWLDFTPPPLPGEEVEV